MEAAGVRGRPRVRAGGMNRKEEVGEVEESGEGWVLDEGTETGAWCERFGGGEGLRWEVSGGSRAAREERWPL